MENVKTISKENGSSKYLPWNLYKATTRLCGLSRQVVSHGR